MTKFISKTIDWETTLTGEVLLLSLLSKILYSEPELEMLENISREDVFSDSPFAAEDTDVINGLGYLQKWSNEFQADDNEEIRTEIKSDYVRIMVGADDFNTPPWESVFFNENRMIFQEETLKVRSWYKRFGLASEKLYNEPDDHIALEISFIAHLASLSLEALKKDDEDTFEKTMIAQHDFLKEHLLQWGPTWCDLVYQNAQTDFYKGTALLLKGALMELKAIFDLEVSR
jgi:TorA maturation chaperone TorD